MIDANTIKIKSKIPIAQPHTSKIAITRRTNIGSDMINMPYEIQRNSQRKNFNYE
jgi:hypothetical protein